MQQTKRVRNGDVWHPEQGSLIVGQKQEAQTFFRATPASLEIVHTTMTPSGCSRADKRNVASRETQSLNHLKGAPKSLTHRNGNDNFLLL